MLRLDPLFLLLLVGGLVFAGLSWLSPPEPATNQIIVDRARLIEFVQYRTRAFDARAAEDIINEMSQAEYEQLRDDYIHEEILFREAAQIGLDESDYVIRRRMVQKMEFLSESLLSAAPPSAEELQTYYDQNQVQFRQSARISFVHYFKAQSDTTTLPANIKLENVGSLSDLFPYQLAYADRPRELIEAHFGLPMADVLFATDTPLETWVGPLRSPHGAHFVFISARQEAYTPQISDLGDALTHAWRQDQRRVVMAQFLEDLRARYDIELRD